MEAIAIEKVKKGDFIKKSPTAKKVWQVSGYCRYNKAYEAMDCDDILCNAAYFKKGRIVYNGFEY